MTVGITDEYIQKVHNLLELWDLIQKFFKVNDMSKLVGKLTQLGKGAPWIFKLMLHLNTSLAYTLTSNTELLEKSSSGFNRDLVKQKKLWPSWASNKIINATSILQWRKRQQQWKKKHLYLINLTMQDELNFIANGLKPDSGIIFETPIAHLIPRIQRPQS